MHMHFLPKGEITSCDLLFTHLHGYTSLEEVVGLYITDLIPSVQIPPPGKKIPKVQYRLTAKLCPILHTGDLDPPLLFGFTLIWFYQL